MLDCNSRQQSQEGDNMKISFCNFASWHYHSAEIELTKVASYS